MVKKINISYEFKKDGAGFVYFYDDGNIKSIIMTNESETEKIHIEVNYLNYGEIQPFFFDIEDSEEPIEKEKPVRSVSINGGV